MALMLLSVAPPCEALSIFEEHYGKLNGIVLDANGARIDKTTITVKNKSLTRKLQTDDAGEFEVELPEGIYTVVFEKQNFYRLTIINVLVRPYFSRELKVHLEVEPIIDIETVKIQPKKAEKRVQRRNNVRQLFRFKFVV